MVISTVTSGFFSIALDSGEKNTLFELCRQLRQDQTSFLRELFEETFKSLREKLDDVNDMPEFNDENL